MDQKYNPDKKFKERVQLSTWTTSLSLRSLNAFIVFCCTEIAVTSLVTHALVSRNSDFESEAEKSDSWPAVYGSPPPVEQDEDRYTLRVMPDNRAKKFSQSIGSVYSVFWKHKKQIIKANRSLLINQSTKNDPLKHGLFQILLFNGFLAKK